MTVSSAVVFFAAVEYPRLNEDDDEQQDQRQSNHNAGQNILQLFFVFQSHRKSHFLR